MQVHQIGRQQSGRLANAGIKTLLQLSELDPRRLEGIVQRSYPFGNHIKQEVVKLLVPRVKLHLSPTRGCPPFPNLPGHASYCATSCLLNAAIAS